MIDKDQRRLKGMLDEDGARCDGGNFGGASLGDMFSLTTCEDVQLNLRYSYIMISIK